MKNKLLQILIILIMLSGLPLIVQARMVHDFDCNNCHKPGMDLISVSGIVCIDCHTSSMVGTSFPLNRTGPGPTNPVSESTFAVGDASDALEAVTDQGESAGDESSHNWAAVLENNAAGADQPSSSLFYGRQNSSGSYLTCSRCHDPHGSLIDTSRGPANPKLLKLGPGSEVQMCNDCHVNWASDQGTTESGGTAPTNVHPMVTGYATIAAAKEEQYNSVVELDAAAGEVALNADGGIDCMSCHGVHWSDSDASTTDGAGETLNVGDGKILRGNGAAVDQANVAGVSLCQSCHKYQDHGTGRSNPIGCLVCHGAHLEDTGGTMNNYMLRASIATYLPKDSASGTVSGLTLNVATAQNQRLWGYCFQCHDSAGAAGGHNSSWDCSACHQHGATDGSWTATGGCNTCHGYPPSVNTVTTGYADGYQDSGHFKDEGSTQHKAHAGGEGDYAFSCSVCHKNNNHMGDDFADTFLAPMDALVDGGGSLSSTYTANTGACTAVYCHSNGGPRGAVPTANDPGVWDGGAAITTCDACHGNDVTDMVTRNNSSVHIAHLNKGYSCQVCHSDTAASATGLASGAIGGTHVDGSADVVFDATSLSFGLGATSYGSDGTCSVYCHSNGSTNVAPDWDSAASGACGTCHQASDAGDSGTALGDAHSIHLFDAGGPLLFVDSGNRGCDACHSNTGSGADHVNGNLDVDDGVCDTCHGSDGASSSGDDRIPIWTDANSVDCETCHAGSEIATINTTAPAKTDYAAAGHGKFAEPCDSCHSSAADNNHLGALGDTDRLQVIGGTTYNSASSSAYCYECHGTDNNNHFANSNSAVGSNSSTDGDNCIICHDPHGQRDGNSDVLDSLIRASINGRTVTGFTDGTLATSYYTDGLSPEEGICQTCHDENEVANFNRTTANTGHGSGTKCVSCHTHTGTPAFKAACNGCHGDTGTGQYWPYGSGGDVLAANDEVGEHTVHVLAISQQLGYGDIATLLAAGDTDTKQKAICAYCHAVNDDDHATGTDAEVFDATVGSSPTDVAKAIWDGSTDANALYDNAADTCSNVDCHNSKLTVDDSYGWHDGATTPGCILCHNDVTSAGTATGQTHLAHTGAASTYGVTINCASCHDADTDWSTKTKPAGNHLDGNFDMGGNISLNYTGSLPTGSSFGSCGTNACHENGLGGTPFVSDYAWGAEETSACGICHRATPTMYDHAIHLSAAGSSYGPKLVDDCGACHDANANNTSMSGKSTHMNNTLTFTDGGSPVEIANGDIDNGTNTIDTCDACHGGATAADIAKGYWVTNDRVTCESCHGDYDLAVIGGITAPSRASTAYDSWGHGRSVGGNTPNQGCAACHAEDSAHISGALGEDRLDLSPNNSKDYSVLAQRNDFCNDCHTTVGAMNVHFDNDNTPGGLSTNGLYCVTCHDPHGQAGFDAMIDSSVGGTTVAAGTRPVAGFIDRTDRDTYRNTSYNGVCQTCHDSSEVDYFDQDAEDANVSHNAGSNCISCHPHTTNPAFKASCNACHGDATTGQYWPDGDGDTQMPTANDDDGRHEAHVVLISEKLGYGDKTALLEHADTDSRQKEVCTYCHAVNDDDHAQSLPAEVFDATVGSSPADVAKAIWDGSTDADASFTKADGTCATVDCHNGKKTTTVAPNDYSWGGADLSNCVMCHVDVTADTTSHTIHIAGSFNFTCSNCHAGTPAWGDTADTGTQSAPSSGHMNGTYAISGGSRAFTYSAGSCGTNECHNDGNMGAPLDSDYDWAEGDVTGLCNECHRWPMNSNNHGTHYDAGIAPGSTEQFMSSSISCTACHTHSGLATPADHFSGSVNFKVEISYSGTTAIADGGSFGTCTTLECHSDGRGNEVETPIWTRAETSIDDCTLCHGDGSGGNISNSHAAHTGTNGATTYTSGTSNQSTSAEYRFDCALCHGTTIGNHIDDNVDLLVGVNWTDGTNTCSTNDCHHDGQGGAPAEDPNWVSGWPTAGDPCAKCHLNSPSSNAHQRHEVGFHYDAVYSGLTGFLPIEDSDSYDTNLDDTIFDQLRGHGGNIGGGTGTSTATTITCYVCHFDTVRNWYNANNATCSGCHTAVASPSAGDMAVGNAALGIFDKSKHVEPTSGTPVQVTFFNQVVRSKAQLRDDLADVAEISNNWTRVNAYKANDGTSYDEQPDTLDNLSSWNSVDKTCTTSCHLWEADRVDKSPVDWEDTGIGCIDCHTRLPM